MSRANEIGNQILWVIGHVFFTIVVVCTARGGYAFLQDYKALSPIQIDLSALTGEDKEVLASALIEDGYSVPREGKLKK